MKPRFRLDEPPRAKPDWIVQIIVQSIVALNERQRAQLKEQLTAIDKERYDKQGGTSDDE